MNRLICLQQAAETREACLAAIRRGAENVARALATDCVSLTRLAYPELR